MEEDEGVTSLRLTEEQITLLLHVIKRWIPNSLEEEKRLNSIAAHLRNRKRRLAQRRRRNSGN